MFAPPADPATFAPAAPPAPLTYDHALSPVRGWWRGALAIVLLVIGYLVVSTVLGGIAIVIDLGLGNLTQEDLLAGTIGFTPALMLLNNLSLAALIPIALLLQRWLFGVRFRWLFSVQGGLRWRWLGRIALIIVPLWVVYLGVTFLLDPSGTIRLDGTAIALLVIVLLTTPLQAAGEESGARGLIQRSAGSWFRNPTAAFVVGTLISGALFCLAHLAGDPWLIAYYFLFGVSMSVAARYTGGLEAPIVVHATNNVLLFIPAVLYGQLSEGIDRSEGAGGPFIILPMVMCVLAAVVSWWWGRRNGVITRAVPPLTVKQERALLPPPPPPAPPMPPASPVEPSPVR